MNHSPAFKEARAQLQKIGIYAYEVPRVETEEQNAVPMARLLNAAIKSRSFATMRRSVMLMFGGYDEDPREITEVPEIRAYLRELDTLVFELPTLLTHLDLGRWLGKNREYNGPVIYLAALLGAPRQVTRGSERVYLEFDPQAAALVLHQTEIRFGQVYERHHRKAEAPAAFNYFIKHINTEEPR